MDKSGIIGEISENLGGVVKQAAKQVAKAPTDLTKKAAQQVTGREDSDSPDSKGSQTHGIRSIINIKPRSPEEIAAQKAKDEVDLSQARQRLHSVYSGGLSTPSVPKESVSQRIEREDQAKKQEEMQTQAHKPPPLPPNVKQGTGEKIPTAG